MTRFSLLALAFLGALALAPSTAHAQSSSSLRSMAWLRASRMTLRARNIMPRPVIRSGGMLQRRASGLILRATLLRRQPGNHLASASPRLNRLSVPSHPAREYRGQASNARLQPRVDHSASEGYGFGAHDDPAVVASFTHGPHGFGAIAYARRRNMLQVVAQSH